VPKKEIRPRLEGQRFFVDSCSGQLEKRRPTDPIDRSKGKVTTTIKKCKEATPSPKGGHFLKEIEGLEVSRNKTQNEGKKGVF